MQKKTKKAAPKKAAKKTAKDAKGSKRSDVFASVASGKAAGDDLTKAIKNAKGRRGTGVSFFTVKAWSTKGLIKLEAKSREVISATLCAAGVKALAG